ncbi:ATP-binding protein [Alicyclobacillus sp. SO9]|uniref:ATP-binding protein n=1 Tax=Alicyclobacillus sp. SO9 TaxID=2665646 RepID=UPI0018E8E85F|nr:SbcC/MukB-like Walker B domain-containing protein [Alicyclobacillus sp. SO9]QQE80528.1 AAA family ATPase [Alicyclobacillus sp. SO9]
MKLLRRALLVKWHYIEHELIDFAPVTFLTGKNAAGKSTILDAMQLVLLGDTAGHFFNKAANDGSRRTLKGYLRGEVGEDEGSGIINLRDGQFSSYIVLEFSEEGGDKPFCMGVVFDSSPDGSVEWRFFSLAEALPDFHFIRDGVPLDIKGLRTWGQMRKNRFEMFESNKRYQEVFLARMGNLNQKFHRLFRKAVPFSPIMDIAGFISEFVCDVKVHLDIDDMRENIRHYRQMEEELRVVESRVKALGEIDGTYHRVEAARDKVKLYEYLVDRAELTNKEEQVAAAKNEAHEMEQQRERIDGEIVANKQTQEQVTGERDVLVEERGNSDAYQRQQRLEPHKQRLEGEFNHIRRDGERHDGMLVDHAERWRATARKLEDTDTWWTSLEKGTSLDVGGVELKLFQSAHLYSEAIRSIREGLLQWPSPAGWQSHTLLDEEITVTTDMTALRNSAERLRQAAQQLAEGQMVMHDAVRAWDEESASLERAISELKRGIKQYDPKVVTLKRLIEDGLSATGQQMAETSTEVAVTRQSVAGESDVDKAATGKAALDRRSSEMSSRASGETSGVSIFAELLEIRNPVWQKAIEGYLHTQRFYLIVPPETFSQALRIYDEVKNSHHLSEVGLVDIDKVMAERPKALSGSLAEEIVTDNPYARAYADYLLGRVMKCDSVDELRNHRTSITQDGMLYHNYVARQINPARFATLYIGKQAIEHQLNQKTTRLERVQTLLQGFRPRLDLVAEWAAQSCPTLSELTAAEDFLQEFSRLSKLRGEYLAILDEMGRLDFTRVEEIGKEIARCDVLLKDMGHQMSELTKKQGALQAQYQRLVQQDIPGLEEEVRDKKHFISSRYDPLAAADMNSRYQQELKRLGSPQTVMANFGRQRSTEKNREEESREELVNQRSDYNKTFGAGFDILREDNDAYRAELTALQESGLTEYAAQIQDAKERAQMQFQEDFINKLRSNIDTVEQQIKALNSALREVSFGGRERYQFKVSPNSQYQPFYAMIMDEMLLEGRSLFSDAFMERHGSVIDELFRKIVDVDEDNQTVHSELEKNLHTFTDYRTYLDFDLVVRDEEGRESRLSRVIAKKSGGETQTPFYIAVLASFAQTYRIHQSGFNNTLRLMIFDEAYSKMDHQRIRDSINLVRDMGMQVILSAPTEKIADIVPLVDRTLVVQRIKSQTRVAPFEPDALEVN